MDDWIKDRVNRIESLSERRILRDVVSGALVNLQHYNEDLYKILENRLKVEIADFRLEFDLYTTICAKEDYDPINDFLFPMDENDSQIVKYKIEDLTKELNLGREVCLTRIFLECETEKIIKLLEDDLTYLGRLVINDEEYEVQLKLRPCLYYKNKLEELYNSFMFNDIAWKTVYAPYLDKFVDVVLVDMPNLSSNKLGLINQVEIDLKEFEPVKLVDRIPLWNVSHLEGKCTHFPMPAYDSINYEHTISLDDLNKEDNYIVSQNNTGILYVKRNKDSLVIVTPEDRTVNWELVCLHSPRNNPLQWIEHPIVTNRRIKSFSDRYAATLSMNIRTKGEVERLLNSFVEFEKWEIVSVELLAKDKILNKKKSLDANFFIADHVRLEEAKPILELRFKTREKNDYLRYDKLNFFISEIQLAFPDYYCIGRIMG